MLTARVWLLANCIYTIMPDLIKQMDFFFFILKAMYE